jgi:hypothetical protein
MNPHDENRLDRFSPAPGPLRLTARLWLLAAAVGGVFSGCKSDLNQQLLERELRYQEDQIYQLQDELEEKRARLTHVAGENESLRRQLGVGSGDDAAPGRGGRPRAPRVPSAAPIPPASRVPDAAPPFRGGPPVDLAPPTLEGVPSLPVEPLVPPAGAPLSLPPAAAVIDPAARPIEPPADKTRPALVRLSHEEPVGGTGAVRLVIKTGGDAPGGTAGVMLAVEPRDAAERLVAGFSGDLVVTAFDAAEPAGSPPLARWVIQAADAAARFRPTGRRRGIPLDLPWQGTLPAGDHVRVQVQAVGGAVPLEAEALVRVR